MSFPTVKSDPYRSKRRKRAHVRLWPDKWWTELCELADDESGHQGHPGLSPGCIALIAAFNLRMEASR